MKLEINFVEFKIISKFFFEKSKMTQKIFFGEMRSDNKNDFFAISMTSKNR
jgi:hypothetical protein